jgi:uncharacterized protein (TIGR03437 family)
MLKATNLLATYNGSTGGATTITSVTLTCNTASGPGASASVWVRPNPALTGTNQLIVSAGALSGTGAANAVVTAPGSQVLNAANSATGIQYTISLAATPLVGCVGLSTPINATFTFARIIGTSVTPNASSTPVADIGMAVASTLTATTSGLSIPTTVNLTCVKNGSTYYPGAAQTVTVSSTATGGTPFSYDGAGSNAVAAWATLNPTAPAGTATGGSPVTFTVVAAAGCDALASSGSNTATTTIHLLNAPAAEQSISVVLTVSPPGASSLVVNPTAITITCSKFGSTYTPTFPQTASVSAASSTPFTIDTSGSASWLTVTATTTPTATTAIPALLAITSGTNCGGGAIGTSNTTTFHLAAPPASDRVVSVTGLIVSPTILQASPLAPSLTYVKGSGTAGFVDVSISSTSVTLPNPFFSVNSATLPSWLRLDSATGTAPKSLRFSSTSVADTLAPGTYSATVVISVAGYGDLNMSVTMLLTNKAPQLTVQAPPSSQACSPASATTFCIPWTIGQALPTPTITAISTDTPIAYTATTGGLLTPTIPVTEQSGLAYSFGTPISVSFSPQAFAAAQPGNTLTGTLTLTWGSPVSTVVITFQVTVQSPGATITSYNPGTLPVESAGGIPYTVSLTGTGFVPSTDPTQTTRVGVVTTSGQPMTFDTNIHVSVVNQSNITLSITIPSGADTIPFAGGNFTLGVCNPVGGTCLTATSSAPMTIGNNPIIQAVTSSSSLVQNSTSSVAPFDMISIFGTNFCPNCTSTQVLTGSPDPVTFTYPTQLQFNSTTSNLSVTFQPHSGSVTGLPANAPILFATNGQINLMVPSAVANASGPVDVVVNYGPSSSLRSSAPFSVTVVATDPGIFTIGADGQGSGAALDLSYNLISATNPAGIRTGSGNSDSISIYVTGMGAPDSTGDNSAAASGPGGVWATDCVTLASYLTSFNNAQTGTALSSLDGTLIVPNVLNTGRLQPCMVSGDITHLWVGGVDVASNVEYVGWVAGTIAGLYQINIKMPDNVSGAFTTAAGLINQSVVQPVQLPVQIVTASGHSQAGVSLWVAPRLGMTGPTSGTGSAANTIGGTVGIALTVDVTNQVVASGGTGTITYAVTSGLLPSGLSLNAANGQISGIPAANTNGSYTVTVTATDSAPIPVTGSCTFVVTIAQGLFMSTTTPTVSTFATLNAGVSTVTASGGVSAYHYSMVITSHSLPTGLTIDAASGVISTTTATPAGSYLLKVTALDSTSGTPLTGSITFTIVIHDKLVATTPVSFSVGGSTAPGVFNTMTTTGGSGTYTYALDVATQAFVNANSAWLSFSTSTGVLTVGSGYVQTSSFTVTVTATDSTTPANASAAGTGSTTFTFVIGS